MAAFLRLTVLSVVLGGGLGYGLLYLATNNQSDLAEHLSSRRTLSEKHSLFNPLYKKSDKLMSQEGSSNVSYKDFVAQRNANEGAEK